MRGANLLSSVNKEPWNKKVSRRTVRKIRIRVQKAPKCISLRDDLVPTLSLNA